VTVSAATEDETQVAEGEEGKSRSQTAREVLGGPLTGPVVAVVGAVLLFIAGFLPVWSTRLIAPQYPKGLPLSFYGDHVEGPVREVNGLNHYIGMQSIDIAQVPEMVLWPLAIIGSGVLLVLAVLWRGWISRLAIIGLWLVPVIVLLDIQRWLITYGTELDPRAALRLEGFMPLAVGSTQVWNFTISSLPGTALIVIWLVALLATLAHFARQPEPRARRVSGAVSLAIAALGTGILLATSAVAAAGPIEDSSGSADPPIPDIQAIVDSAPPGSTVVVPEGTHRVHLVVDKPLELVADGEVYLDGGGIGSVVTITGDDVSLRGFDIGNSGGQVEVGSGIKIIEADNVTIEQNTLRDFFHGIASLGSTNVRIRDNTLVGAGIGEVDESHLTTGRDEGHAAVVVDIDPRSIAADASGPGPEGQGDGIYLWNTVAATVADNDVSQVRDGVYLSFVEDGLVDSNTITGSRYAIHSMFGGPVMAFGNSTTENLAGLVFMYTKDVVAGRNLIEDQRSAATGVGVMLKEIENVRISENVITGNRVGLKADGTHRAGGREAAILRNRFDSNGTAVSLFPSADMGFAANTFEGNLTDVHADDRGVARRNDWTYQGTGNHWADYAGYDLDEDGIGDVPHTASGSLQLLLADVPALEIFRGSAALHALDSAQELWEADRAVVMQDKAPRVGDHAPMAADLDAESTRAASMGDGAAGWYGLGLALATLALLGLTLGRVRRRASRA
jgi:nitrous oxidase accessory protein